MWQSQALGFCKVIGSLPRPDAAVTSGTSSQSHLHPKELVPKTHQPRPKHCVTWLEPSCPGFCRLGVGRRWLCWPLLPEPGGPGCLTDFFILTGLVYPPCSGPSRQVLRGLFVSEMRKLRLSETEPPDSGQGPRNAGPSQGCIRSQTNPSLRKTEAEIWGGGGARSAV